MVPARRGCRGIRGAGGGGPGSPLPPARPPVPFGLSGSGRPGGLLGLAFLPPHPPPMGGHESYLGAGAPRASASILRTERRVRVAAGGRGAEAGDGTGEARARRGWGGLCLPGAPCPSGLRPGVVLFTPRPRRGAPGCKGLGPGRTSPGPFPRGRGTMLARDAAVRGEHARYLTQASSCRRWNCCLQPRGTLAKACFRPFI